MLLAMDRQLVDLGAGEAEQRRQQRDGRDHRDQHNNRRRDTHHRHRRDTGEVQAEDGDHDGRAREQHGLSGGGVGGAGGVGDAHALVHVLAVTGDDEERVVDADSEPDHHADDLRDARHFAEPGEDAHARSTDEDADQRGADG